MRMLLGKAYRDVEHGGRRIASAEFGQKIVRMTDKDSLGGLGSEV